MKFTVLIVTYHPDWKKLLVTLDSVMAQTFKDYEIVVSDDGSEENCFDKIEAYFAAHQFANYTLIPHEKNQGTVKNLIDGLAKAKGKYVRDFGPGDAFYNEHTLQQVYDFMEEMRDIPFEIKRVYYMYDTVDGVRRGYHAHRCLEQILIPIHGTCKIHLDNGSETAEVLLDKPYEGLYIANNMWREMYDFSEDAVLMVLASEYYDENDYIRDYDKFLAFVKEENKDK